ncbi:hypothetical protein MMC32_008161 [Xylographa parallela]|nr:hypothetical protein [Xylographa parallela]
MIHQHNLLHQRRPLLTAIRIASLRRTSTEQFPSSSSGASVPCKPVSPHVGFYQTFGRPIAKVFLGAIFTYQVTYWLWTKLEMDEIKHDKTAEISGLEAKLASELAAKTKVQR